MASTLEQRGRSSGPPEARWRPPLSPPSPRTPSWSPERDKDVAALRSGNLRKACGSARTREATPPRRARGAVGGAVQRAVQPALGTQRVDASKPAHSWPLFSGPGPQHPPLRPRTGSCSPVGPAPLPQRPGSDLRRLLQSGQEEGGSPESGAPRVLLLLLPPRLRRRPSDLSFCRSRRGASQTTRAKRFPAEASSAAASGARGAADRLAVQVSDACPGRPGRGWGRRAGGGDGGVSGRRPAEAQAQGPDAEIAHSAFYPGTSCGTSPGWNPGRGVRCCAGERTPESRRLRRGPPSPAPP